MLQEKEKKKSEDMGLCAFMMWPKAPQEQRPRGQSECVKTNLSSSDEYHRDKFLD